MTLVLFWGFVAGVFGGFVGHVLFDWQYKKYLQHRYRRRAPTPPEHEFRTSKDGCGDPECGWCNANMRPERRTNRGWLS